MYQHPDKSEFVELKVVKRTVPTTLQLPIAMWRQRVDSRWFFSFPTAVASSARKTVQWTVFSEMGPAGPWRSTREAGDRAPLSLKS